MQINVKGRKITSASCRVILLLLCIAGVGGVGIGARGQSTDIGSPSPVRTNELVGTIGARDLGDPRLTDHFYAFLGTPGDVLITVESSNLNGDIDIFTSAGLRPLLKFTVYAGSSSPITKSIYLRKQEDLLLRVEARTPNDDDGQYRIRFSGSFEPITSGPLLAGSENAPTQPATAVSESGPKTRTGKKGRRVSSVGARIEEPPSKEVAVAPTPEPTPADARETRESKSAARKSSSRNSRTRRPVSGRTRSPEPAKTDEAAAKNETENKPPVEGSETEAKTTPARRRPTRRSATARGVVKRPIEQEPEDSGPRLVIETSDGTLVDRYMTSVRRVTVENGQVVVIAKDGKIQRIPLASVVRMTISP